MKDLDIEHCYNMIIMDNGEGRCIDVFWGDLAGYEKYFLETKEANAISHTKR